ncbi:hypothetical protein ACK1KB_13665 [Chryseobacterium sp. TY3]
MKGSPRIVSLTIFDSNRKRISEKPKYGQTLVAEVKTQNMFNEKLLLQVWERDTLANSGHDAKENTLLYEKHITVNLNGLNYEGVVLTELMMKKAQGSGPSSMMEGGEHEYYLVVKHKNHATYSSQTIQVLNEKITVKGTGTNPPPENKGRTATSVDPSPNPPPQTQKQKCFCNRDFEEKDVRTFVRLLKGSETIWEGQALKGGKRAECNISDKSFGILTNALNKSFKKYNINHCSQKMHFLAQVCEETGVFALSEETKSDFLSSQSIYKGRGLLQLTGVRTNPNDNKSYFDKPGPFQDYANYRGNQNIVKTPEMVANHIDYCIDSGTWIWSVNKKMTNNPKSEAIVKWGGRNFRYVIKRACFICR